MTDDTEQGKGQSEERTRIQQQDMRLEAMNRENLQLRAQFNAERQVSEARHAELEHYRTLCSGQRELQDSIGGVYRKIDRLVDALLDAMAFAGDQVHNAPPGEAVRCISRWARVVNEARGRIDSGKLEPVPMAGRPNPGEVLRARRPDGEEWQP